MVQSRLARGLVAGLASFFVLGGAGLAAPAATGPHDSGPSMAEVEELYLRGFRTRIVAPFLVAGTMDAESFDQHVQTVQWALTRFRKQLFKTRGLDTAVTVYLYGDAASYEAGAREITGSNPGTPFGFYSGQHNALVMNIATGGGTMIHEMVHPLLEADCPGVPSWINEGIASLFEQSSERRGRIVGLTNWRLAGLQRAIARGTTVSLRSLMTTTSAQFYGDESGLHYAEARYLMYWLQEQGLLEAFYERFRTHRKEDPTGRESVEFVLGAGSYPIEAHEAQWHEFVSGLVFR